MRYEGIRMVFEDRQEAGRKLAEKLQKYQKEDTIVVALPRGGVVVGYEIARSLDIPLGILIVRKIGAPRNPEYGIGAIASGGIVYIDEDATRTISLTNEEISLLVQKENRELTKREQLYQIKRQILNLKKKTVILVDDGLATGVTAKAALLAIHKQKPKKVVFAVPGCPVDSEGQFKRLVDEFLCLEMRYDFVAVGKLYRSFQQITDEEVLRLLKDAKAHVN